MMESIKFSIPEQLMHSTVRLKCKSSKGTFSTGTGFFFKYFEDGKTHVPVIVTNKHVIEGAVKGTFHLTLKDEKSGKPLIGDHYKIEFDNFEKLWHLHPDKDIDLAIFPYASLIKQAESAKIYFYHTSLDSKLIPTMQGISSLSGLDDIIMVGYPDGLWDSKNNFPIFRSGSTASHPKYDYKGKPLFLIDCACFRGSSGSPIFIYNPTGWFDREKKIFINKERLFLLGILSDGHLQEVTGFVEETGYSLRFNIPNNLGHAIKAQKLFDFEPILENLRKSA